jgi:hypothetical protein
MKIKTTHSSPTASNVTVFSSGIPHPHQPEPETHPQARVRPHHHPRASRLGYQSVIAAARSRDRDPLDLTGSCHFSPRVIYTIR